MQSHSQVSSVRIGEVRSNCARWVMASFRHEALDRVSAKCSEEPFLYDTVKVYRCRKSIIFCKHLGAISEIFLED